VPLRKRKGLTVEFGREKEKKNKNLAGEGADAPEEHGVGGKEPLLYRSTEGKGRKRGLNTTITGSFAKEVVIAVRRKNRPAVTVPGKRRGRKSSPSDP